MGPGIQRPPKYKQVISPWVHWGSNSYDAFRILRLYVGRPGAQDMIFDHQEVLNAHEEILENAGIRRHCSKDLADLISEN